MTETFSIQVHPDAVNSCIQTYESFGWSVLSTQEVVRTLPPKQVGDMIENVTETYNKVTFQREITPHTPKLKEYQQEYEKCLDRISDNQASLDACRAPELHFKRILVYIVLGLLWLFVQMIPLTVICGALVVVRIVRYAKAYSAYRKDHKEKFDRNFDEKKELEARAQEILTESRAYLAQLSAAG